jgi:hypothetical protein
VRKFSFPAYILSVILFSTVAFAESGPASVAGKWQVSWTGRIGTENAVLLLRQSGTNLSGTFRDVHGVSQVTGKIENAAVSFDVAFQGKKPFTIIFTGTLENGSLKGSSKSKDAGGYLGHGGEIIQPDRPWTAKRGRGRRRSRTNAKFHKELVSDFHLKIRCLSGISPNEPT